MPSPNDFEPNQFQHAMQQQQHQIKMEDHFMSLQNNAMQQQMMMQQQLNQQQQQQLPHEPQTQNAGAATAAKSSSKHSVMEAANALTALNDKDEEEQDANADNSDDNNKDAKEGSSQKKPSKRFIPEHKKPDAALTFPEKLMHLMKFANGQEDKANYCISWLEDGKSFVIRDPDGFTRQVLPKFFKATKFSSFTRKLYRWGFRQVNRGIGPDDPIIFGNEYFQRDDPELMKKMRSVTAASTRKTEQAGMLIQQQQQLQQQQQQYTLNMMGMNKRSFDATGAITGGGDPKRILLEQWMQQQKAMAQQNMYNSNPGAGMNLTSALGRNPHFNPASLNAGGSGGGMKAFDMMGLNAGNHQGNHHQMAPSNPLFSSFQMNSFGQQNDNNNQQQQHGQMNGQQFQQHNQMNNHQMNSQGNGYPTTASTADIVNAAIKALKYAS